MCWSLESISEKESIEWFFSLHIEKKNEDIVGVALTNIYITALFMEQRSAMNFKLLYRGLTQHTRHRKFCLQHSVGLCKLSKR